MSFLWVPYFVLTYAFFVGTPCNVIRNVFLTRSVRHCNFSLIVLTPSSIRVPPVQPLVMNIANHAHFLSFHGAYGFKFVTFSGAISFRFGMARPHQEKLNQTPRCCRLNRHGNSNNMGIFLGVSRGC